MKIEHNPPNEDKLSESMIIYALGKKIVVPVGFQTDWASVPGFLKGLFPSRGLHSRAAVLHDWLYFKRLWSKPKCDRAFLEVMIRDGVPIWRALIMYIAVYFFGGRVYQTDDDE